MATPATPARPAKARVAGIGCFMAVIGAFSGGMIAVLISMGVAKVTGAPRCDGIPTCDWHYYWGAGALVGLISLPWLVVSALMSPPKQDPAAPDTKN
jgi:hypothetical protein